MSCDDEERELVRQARAGDPAAFETLVGRHQQYVYNLALRVVNSPDDAADLAQQAFVRAWQGLGGFRGEARFSTWLYRIVANLCYTRLPRIRAELAVLPSDDEGPADEHQQPEHALEAGQTRAAIQQVFAALPESYRLLVTLRHLQGMSYEEIAQVTGQPLGTVKTGIFRARRLLRGYLEEQEVSHG